jgi:hypothetical protein
MKKLILLSMLFAIITLPTLAARSRNPVQGVKRAVALMVLFNFLYTFAVLVIWYRLGP